MIDRYQKACVIGLWRMGNPDVVIAAILNLTLWEVINVIKIYENN